MEKQNQEIQEMQILEQNLQNLMYQKQVFQMELSETENALKEIENAKDEVFKIIGQLMIKTDKDKIKKELEDKQKMLSLRVDTIDKQETSIKDKVEEVRNKILNDDKK